MLRVAVILAGIFRGTLETALEFQRVVVHPLRTSGFVVDAYAAGYSHDEAEWRKWFTYSNSTNFVFVNLLEDNVTLISRPESASYFSRCTEPYHIRMMHLNDAWLAAEKTGVYDFVIKTRNDVNYGPGQFVKPCWLRGLADNFILVNDKELHQEDRWNERGIPGMPNEPPKTPWAAQLLAPAMLSDQFLIGTRASMSQILTMVNFPPNNGSTCRQGNSFWEWMGRDFPPGPESFIADFLYRRKIAWYTISMQLERAPSRDFIMQPCRLCYDCVQGDPM